MTHCLPLAAAAAAQHAEPFASGPMLVIGVIVAWAAVLWLFGVR